jgi:hypothetical protein
MTTRDQLRALKMAQPFRPFLLRLADGRVIAGDRTEGFCCNPAGTEMHFYDQSELIAFIDMATAEIINA